MKGWLLLKCNSSRALLGPAVATFVLVGCGAGKREAASLVAAVDRYRRAEMGIKPSLVAAIEASPCTDTAVCQAKSACLASAVPTAKGEALKFEVEGSLADLHAGKLTQEQAAARDLGKELDEASRLLEEGHAKLSACDAQIMALRLKYGI